MTLTQSITSVLFVVAFGSCGPTAEECAAIESEEECSAAGCDGFTIARYFEVREEECSRVSTELESLCYRTRDGDKTRESAPSGHFIAESDATKRVLVLNHSPGPIVGWEPCPDDPDQLCGCSLELQGPW